MRRANINSGVFSWCMENNHANCIRQYERFYIDMKTKRPVYTGEICLCACTKRGCKCKGQEPIKKTEDTKPL